MPNYTGLVPPDVFTGWPSATAKGDPAQQGPTTLCRASWAVSPRTSCTSEFTNDEFMIEERCSLQCPLHTLYPSHHFPCLILYSGKFLQEKGYIIKQKCLRRIFHEWQSICKIGKKFLPQKFSANRYALCCLFWHAKAQDVSCIYQNYNYCTYVAFPI